MGRIGLKWMSLFLIVLLASTLLSGCFKKEKIEEENIVIESKNDSDAAENEAQEETIEEEKTGVFIGDKAYDFALLDREGNEIKLSDLQGKVVFINFWTTWCGFCTQEMPHIQEVYDGYKDKDVVILAVNVLAAEKRDMEDVNIFLEDNGYTFPVLYDVDGDISVRYKVRAFPTTYIIDKEGLVADFIAGAMEQETMVEKIENVRNK